MRLKFYLPLLSIIFAFALISFNSEDDGLMKLLEKFQKYTDNHVQEKVYLHTDKPYYAIGDDIWFKAYVVDAQNLKPSLESNIVYIDLINSKNLISKTLRVPLTAGFGWGNFELKDSLIEGNYRLRAYTSLMRNYSDAFYFDRTIKIGNVWSSQMITKTNFSFSKDGDKDLVKATINYSNIDGYPYGNKEVTYSVNLGDKTVAKGKGETDAKGNLSLNFTNDKPILGLQDGINTNLKIAENTIIDKFIPITSTSNQVDVQFFAEGGDLIYNLRNRIAFKAVGSDGLGKNITGYIKDNEGNKLALINSRHLGMGSTYLAPVEGKTYEAIVKFEDGSEKTFKLPQIKTEGITLNINPNMPDSIFAGVIANQAFAAKNQNKIYTLIAQSSGSVIYTAKSKLKGTAFAAKLSKKRFPQGITQFTLFDDALNPVAERLVFILPKNNLDLNLSLNKQAFATRENVSIAIKALNSGKPIIGCFSISVTDDSKVNVPLEKEHTIFTDLLLTSDLKGFVENPNYYFENIDENKLIDIDVLMMTQGWRRFAWQNVINNLQLPLIFKPEKTLFIAGKVTQGKDKPVVNGMITLFSSGKNPLLLQSKTDANGEFKIDSLYFTDSTKFVIQARNERGKKEVDIALYNNNPQKVTPNKNLPNLTSNINESMLTYLKNSKTQYEDWIKNGLVTRSLLLAEVKVVEKARPLIDNSSNLNGAGNADRVITEKDLQNAITIQEAIQGTVAGLNIQNGIIFIRGQQAQIVMDGIFIEQEFLNSININDIESIEILKSINFTAIYGGRGSGGVVVINTKIGKPGYVNTVYAPGIVTFSPMGLFKPKEFYVPNYNVVNLNNSTSADLRSTIYWNPAIVTDFTGNAKVSFYNADGTGNYKVVLEGMDLNGHLGRMVIKYKVNPK